MNRSDVDLVRCPQCREALRYRGSEDPEGLVEGQLDCDCGAAWPVRNRLPVLYREAWVRGPDKLMRYFYDNLPRLHDPAVRYLLPLMQLGGTEESLRGGYLPLLELGALEQPPNRPARILETGIGGGANLPLVLRALPRGLDFEYWGLDLSAGMLRHCRRRIERLEVRTVRLVQGDAHALPFADNSFDRVFHVGGIGGYRDPGLGLAEMGRVALPDTPILVVDEQLDPSQSHNAWHKLTFRALTFYDKDPHCPRELVPTGAYDIHEEHVTRFYYALRFYLK